FYIDNVCFQESTVGIETPVAKSEIQLFPNPADQFMTISSSENLQSVRIFNSVGQVVFQDKMDSQSIQVNVQSYKPGLYTVQVTTENGNEIKKFMKR
ncbi:T9SS type A sorting domain-containing protein, partial [bacterium]|nr:T9SS type A sorting domain-containing protein [bacterium]